jgi:YidC/Oxa1 family membrane protein insertase
MLSILYYLIIYPIELLVEVTFSILNLILNNPGLSIVGVSLVINFLILPMYRRSDALQETEREEQKKLSHWVKHIRRTFHGDEQFMMLQEYYRQNGYKPIYALRGSVSLLLQIPFFIAAYHYLSNLSVLQGTPFLFISDMGKPDGLIRIGSMSINLLPILMTAINFLSGAIYTKGFELKDKLQLYIMALLFLALLYTSPSGLVLYWTCNNTFSLLKNIFFKQMKHPKEVFAILAAGGGIGFFILVRTRYSSLVWFSLGLLVLLISLIPLIKWLRRICSNSSSKISNWFSIPYMEDSSSSRIYFAGAVFIVFLVGILIPSAAIVSSPEEFVYENNYINPLHYLIYSASIAAGCFVIWGGILFSLAEHKSKGAASISIWILSITFMIDYLFFGRKYGDMTPELNFFRVPDPSSKEKWLNILLLITTGILLYAVWKRFRNEIHIILSILAVCTLILSGVNIKSINDQMNAMSYVRHSVSEQNPSDKVIHLSKKGKNVVVLMLDRAISGYVPYIMEEKPELQKEFSGFVYYPNTISYGGYTLLGAPPLFGGYEYTPEKMNLRKNESMKDKHDEALKVMPVLFLNNNYRVTVCDPPYAGYQEVADLSIYKDYPQIKTYHLIGHYSDNAGMAYSEKRRIHNFFCYGIFKVSPSFIKKGLYDNGKYLSTEKETDDNRTFDESYDVLRKLSTLTEADDSEQNQFVMITNDATHEPSKLQMPDYTVQDEVDNTAYEAQWAKKFYSNGSSSIHMDTEDQKEHYYINIASFLQLGKWFAYLREQGVWDNTRIILVSDHGNALGQIDSLLIDDKNDAQRLNPLLMVKDFSEETGEKGSGVTVSNSFMTNADVPSIATQEIIDDPQNPFTGRFIDSMDKTAGAQQVTIAPIHNVSQIHGNTLNIHHGEWYDVQKDIFNHDNWKKVNNN